jgi:hypothetical protein
VAEEVLKNEPMSKSFRGEVLEQLRAMGSDTGRPHAFDLFLYVPDQSAAAITAERIRERGYFVEISPSASGSGLLCKAKTVLIPETAPLDEMAAFFESLASAVRGEFDGWESDVVKPQ